MKEKKATIEAEVRIVGEAGDIHFELTFNAGKWTLEVQDIGSDAHDYDEAISQHVMFPTTKQAAAIMALFVGIGKEPHTTATEKMLVACLYELAEPVFDGVPQNLRIIP